VTTPVIAFFNNKGGVGKTSLVYHLAWMMADQGHRVVAVDFDPQANLTSAFLDENQVERLWTDDDQRQTVWGAIRPFLDRSGPLGAAPLVTTSDHNLVVLPGDLQLATLEDNLSAEWPRCLDEKPDAFQVMSTFWRLTQDAASQHGADVVLVDVGPSLGAINRAALLASDHVVVPVAPDLFSLQGLHNLGPTLDGWRRGWRDRLERKPPSVTDVPGGEMNVLGYVVLQHGVRLDRPVRAYQRWMDQIPGQFQTSVLGRGNEDVPRMDEDPYCLGQLKHYHSLMPLAQEARKPIFALTAADGALGGHFQAARDAYGHFDNLAKTILHRAGIVS
jgi:chromosome partitioning protein